MGATVLRPQARLVIFVIAVSSIPSTSGSGQAVSVRPPEIAHAQQRNLRGSAPDLRQPATQQELAYPQVTGCSPPDFPSGRVGDLAATAAAHSATGDGTWYGFTPVGREGHSAIYDPVRDRMIVFGGLDKIAFRNDVWTLSLDDTSAWTPLSPAGTPPGPRWGHSAIYDPVRNRMVVFGGVNGGTDVWALSLDDHPTWEKLHPSGTPPGTRAEHRAIYDPARDRMVIFGGADGSLHNDIWALSLGATPAWSQLTPTGAPPSGRRSHTAIYDPARDRMVVFGGSDGCLRNDVWALSFAGTPAWTELTAAGTPPTERLAHTAIYDPTRDRMVVFAGFDTLYNRCNDAWSLSFGGAPGWSRLTPAGTLPRERSGHSAIYDPARDRMVVFGGLVYNDVWGLALSDVPEWTQVGPGVRTDHTAIHDPLRDRMIVFGGTAPYSPDFNDVWALSLAGTPAWTRLQPAGTPPLPRYDHAAVHDPLRDRMIVFGGWGPSSPLIRLGDVWALSLGGPLTWSELAPVGTPISGRFGHSAIYDALRDRAIVFAGCDDLSYYRNDVWELSLSDPPAWTELAPVGKRPVQRIWHSAIYDPVRDRMVVFGGLASVWLNDVWALSLTAPPVWSRLEPAGTAPSAQAGYSAIYDAARDRMVVLGSNGDSSAVWALSLSGTPEWTRLAPAGAPPAPLGNRGCIYDPVRDQMVIFAASGGSSSVLCTLLWGTPGVAVPDSGSGSPKSLQFDLPQPNPSRGSVTFRFALPRLTHVVITVHDAAGRIAQELADGEFPPGRHVVVWNRRGWNGHLMRAGLYFVRLQVPGSVITRKVALVQ